MKFLVVWMAAGLLVVSGQNVPDTVSSLGVSEAVRVSSLGVSEAVRVSSMGVSEAVSSLGVSEAVSSLGVSEAVSPDEPASGDLVQFHILMRHGARAPIQTFKGDNTTNSTSWPRGLGHLVKKGLEEHDRLGIWLRMRYGSLLNTFPDFSQFHVISSDVERCLNSAQANLARVFKPTTKSEMYRDMSYTPVPVHTVPVDQDLLLDIGKACPALKDAAHDGFIKCTKAKDLMKKHSTMIKMLEKELKYKMPTIEQVDWVYDTFKIHKENGYPIPKYINSSWDELKEMTYWFFDNYAKTETLKKLRGGGGPLIQKILGDMEGRVNGTEKRTMFMYSAHDTTVAANLQTLGAYNGVPPPYASAVIYELYNVSGQYQVKILFENNTNFDAEPKKEYKGLYYLKVPKCKGNLTVAGLRDAMEDFLPGALGELGYYDACSTTSGDGLSYGGKLAILIVVPIVASILACLGFIYCKKKC